MMTLIEILSPKVGYVINDGDGLRDMLDDATAFFLRGSGV